MKKIFLFITVLSIFLINGFSQENDTEKSSDETWKEIGEQGKKALVETGKFFKSAGEEIGNQIKDTVKTAVVAKCYGTWVYEGEKVRTTMICNEDGTMEIRQKDGFELNYWKGVYTVSLNKITFSVKESGHKSFFAKHSQIEDKNWLIFFILLDDGNKIKITSSDIPKPKDGTSYFGLEMKKQ